MIKNILWDFDGVILDSMKIRDFGFREIFKSFPKLQVEELIKFHRDNGGLSRYVKIRYFYEDILNQAISEEKVNAYANNFSVLMREKLTEKHNLIEDSMNFIKDNYERYNFHIVSGSDQNELRFLCDELDISVFFDSIHGSPTPKKELVKHVLETEGYTDDETCLIGDSKNDYDAAKANQIHFVAYNNDSLNVFNTRPPFY
ncbi:HAD family hydrolase [Flagellimonas baculiformis]|uniref:HAD family hydrolase n=1 Tax=Flagellimonas baculiformis TaxID=3067310 RepID=UPI00296EF7FF|nr:HAD hydrolase-like protein [Muricauda sp. D6]